MCARKSHFAELIFSRSDKNRFYTNSLFIYWHVYESGDVIVSRCFEPNQPQSIIIRAEKVEKIYQYLYASRTLLESAR